jgi:hypothetical protein
MAISWPKQKIPRRVRKKEQDMVWRARSGGAELEAFKMLPRPMLERFAHMADHTRRAEVEAA